MDKEDVVCIYTYSATRKKEILLCYSMDEPEGHFAEWNKPKKDKWCVVPLTREPPPPKKERNQFHGNRLEWWLLRVGGGAEIRRCMSKGTDFQLQGKF